MIERVIKRDGEIVPFKKERIERAITLAAGQSEKPMDTDTCLLYTSPSPRD